MLCYSLWGFYLEHRVTFVLVHSPAFFWDGFSSLCLHFLSSLWLQNGVSDDRNLLEISHPWTGLWPPMTSPWWPLENVGPMSPRRLIFPKQRQEFKIPRKIPLLHPLVTEQTWAPSVDSGACPLWGKTMDSVGEKQPRWKEWHWQNRVPNSSLCWWRTV